jgi:hypothetical protein
VRFTAELTGGRLTLSAPTEVLGSVGARPAQGARSAQGARPAQGARSAQGARLKILSGAILPAPYRRGPRESLLPGIPGKDHQACLAIGSLMPPKRAGAAIMAGIGR